MIELLVVIAIIAILAAMLLPVLAKSKQQAHSIKCMNNGKQMLMSWIMYAGDNHEKLPNNLGTTNEFGGWVNGVMSETFGNSDNTNTDFMTGAPSIIDGMLTNTPTTIGAYVKSAAIYRCPGDPSIALGYGMPRCRSYSMNFALGDKSPDGAQLSSYGNYWPNFFKTTDLNLASKTWVFSDEHADSINDGIQYPATSNAEDTEWGDLPASYHNGACDYSFADGHSEIHKWLNPNTVHAIVGNDFWLPYAVAGSKVDINWVESHCSPRLSGAPNQAPGQ